MTRKRACDVCYKRKIQCTILGPESPCEWCAEHDLSCTFDRKSEKKKRKRLRLSDVEGLFNRVEQLESALAESPPELERPASPSSDNQDDTVQSESEYSPDLRLQLVTTESTESPLTAVPLDAQPTYLSFGQNPANGVPLSQYWYSRGIPLLSDRGDRYIYSKTNQSSVAEKLRIVKCPSHLQPIALPLRCSNRELWELPAKETVKKLASVFFKSALQQTFPVLEKLLFETTIEEAYGYTKGLPSSSQAQSIACVFALLSICDLSGLSKGSSPIGQGHVYTAKAQCILMHIMTETSIVGLQTVLMLQRCYMFGAQMERVSALHAMACRMVCTLGGHTYQPPTHSIARLTSAELQGQHLRVLFWLCYLADKDISLRLGQTPLLSEEYCDLTIPNRRGQLQGSDVAVTSNMNHFSVPGDSELYMLKENIYRLLFSHRAFKISDGELVCRIRQLDHDLENWRLSTPVEIRPKLSIPPTQMTPTQEPYTISDIKCARLQLEYHHLITAIHTTVRRCGANNPEHRDLPDDIHNVIHSSCDLSLEASRSTITFLKSSSTTLGEQEFSDVIFYITLAVISLFIDILAHPQGAESHITISYLSSAIDITQSLSNPTSRQDQLEKVQETNRFIMELIDLGKCAVEKAERDNRSSPTAELFQLL
ncbi:hypothetical protein F4678DRAFT_468706 [Xylaria arbuscula]|nr:hypothetical protein F4678DRAFT_468706 [Xylaria arbuscula]